MRARSLARVASALYVTVLLGGAYFAVAGLAPFALWRFVVFGLGLVALLVLEQVFHPALVVRALLIHAVAAADTSGLARVLFLLVPFTVYLTLGRRAGNVTAAAYGAGLLVWWTLADTRWFTDSEALGDLVMFLVGLVLAVAMAAVAVAADADRARAEQLVSELAAAQHRVAVLAAAEERNRVARDLHDSLGHHLTAVAIQLEKAVAYRERDPAVADRAVTDAHGSAREALADVRRSVAALRTDGSPLIARLAELASGLRSTGTAVTCVASGDIRDRSAEVEDVLFRVAQEGVTNALRHAGAGSVTVSVHFAADVTTLAVRDDGTGLPSATDSAVAGRAAAAGGPVVGGRDTHGLVGMRERLAAVGGTLELIGPPGAGTTLTARVPT